MKPADLIAFEQEIEAEFNVGHIKAPVHLAGGNEEQLIEIFKSIEPSDWVLCTWRSHYHALLKGVPREEVKDAIMAGRSISLCFPDYLVLSSGIAGGICPIAVGLALAGRRVWAFVGDMTAEMGIFHECWKYAAKNDLPVHWVIEDNGMSVLTNTRESWGTSWTPQQTRYQYKMTRPHVGTGTFVRF